LFRRLRSSIVWSTFALWAMFVGAAVRCYKNKRRCDILGDIIYRILDLDKLTRNSLIVLMTVGTVFMLASFFDIILQVLSVLVITLFHFVTGPLLNRHPPPPQ
jgi:hypothetical protein